MQGPGLACPVCHWSILFMCCLLNQSMIATASKKLKHGQSPLARHHTCQRSTQSTLLLVAAICIGTVSRCHFSTAVQVYTVTDGSLPALLASPSWEAPSGPHSLRALASASDLRSFWICHLGLSGWPNMPADSVGTCWAIAECRM